jgi:hypothetical protein
METTFEMAFRRPMVLTGIISIHPKPGVSTKVEKFDIYYTRSP